MTSLNKQRSILEYAVMVPFSYVLSGLYSPLWWRLELLFKVTTTYSIAFNNVFNSGLKCRFPTLNEQEHVCGGFYLRSLPLKGTTWIPRGPPSFDTSTSLTMSLGNGNGQRKDRRKGSGNERSDTMWGRNTK